MAKIVQNITLDTSKSNIMLKIYAKQHDTNSRFLNITLQNNNEPINIESNATAIIAVKRSDDASNAFPCTITEDGTVLAPLSSWILGVEGLAHCEISIITASGEVLTTLKFRLWVEEKLYTGEVSENDPTYTVIEQLIIDVENLKKNGGGGGSLPKNARVPIAVTATQNGRDFTLDSPYYGIELKDGDMLYIIPNNQEQIKVYGSYIISYNDTWGGSCPIVLPTGESYFTPEFANREAPFLVIYKEKGLANSSYNASNCFVLLDTNPRVNISNGGDDGDAGLAGEVATLVYGGEFSALPESAVPGDIYKFNGKYYMFTDGEWQLFAKPNAMYYCNEVSALPEEANEGDVYKVTESRWFETDFKGGYADYVEITQSLISITSGYELYKSIIDTVNEAGGFPARIKIDWAYNDSFLDTSGEVIFDVASHYSEDYRDQGGPVMYYISGQLVSDSNPEYSTQMGYGVGQTFAYYGTGGSELYVYHGEWEKIAEIKANGATDTTRIFLAKPTSSSGSAYAATIKNYDALKAGDMFVFIPDVHSNGTSCTLNINELGAKRIYRASGDGSSTVYTAIPVADYLCAGVPYVLVYNGTYFYMQESRPYGGTDFYSAVAVSKGGTGKTSFSANRIIYPSASTIITQLAFPTEESVLAQKSSGAPYWIKKSELGGTSGAMVFKGVVDELPDTANDGEMYAKIESLLNGKEFSVSYPSVTSTSLIAYGGYEAHEWIQSLENVWGGLYPSTVYLKNGDKLCILKVTSSYCGYDDGSYSGELYYEENSEIVNFMSGITSFEASTETETKGYIRFGGKWVAL